MKVYLTRGHIIEVNDFSVQVKGGWWNKYQFQEGDPLLSPNSQEDLEYVSELLSKIKNPVLFDIGANVGMFALLTTIHKTLKVHTFEPSFHLTPVIRENCGLNKVLDRVTINQIALYNEDTRVILKIPIVIPLAGLATIGQPQRYGHWVDTPVPALKLDTHMEQANIHQLDIIKIDTEGAELSILQGGEQTIKDFRPHIICECYGKNTHQFGYEPQEIIDLLTSWGYSHKWISKENVHFFMSEEICPSQQ